MKSIKLTIAALLVFSPFAANADVIWDWSFDNTSGQFVTNGTDSSAGVFTLLDFSVTASDLGATLGSVLGGEYALQGFSTDPLYTMVWDGSAVTAWLHSGLNTFNWWVFDDLATNPGYVFFGWENLNINTVDQGAYFTTNSLINPSFLLSVAPSSSTPVSEPGTLALLGLGLVGMAARRKKKV